MKIRTKYSLLTAGLIGAVVSAMVVTVTRTQKRALEQQSRERLEAVMEGVSRIASEAIEGRDELMLISYLMFLQKERPELAHAAVTRRGHTSTLGAERPGLLYLSRTLVSRRPVTYTVTGYPLSANPADQVSVSSAGVTLAVAGKAMVRISEERRPETLVVRLGFLQEALDAELRRALRPLIKRTLAIAGTFMTLGLLGSLGLSKLLTGPLLALSGAVAEVEHGNLDVSVSARRDDEVGVLAKRFNSMTLHIKELLSLREDVLHTLTHELNTPLGGLKGYLELWQQRGVSEEARAEVLQTMTAAVLRMENSLGNALRLFKSSAGAPSAPRKIVWLDQIFDEARALYAPVARSKKIEVERAPGGAAAFVWGEEEALRHIAGNLFANALKYTPAGGKVQIGVEDSAEEVVFWISDNGYGIPASDLPHLFTKFYRGQAGHQSERIPGTGLGLSIAHKAAQSLGGRITVESKVGEGTTFRVFIPKLGGWTQEAA